MGTLPGACCSTLSRAGSEARLNACFLLLRETLDEPIDPGVEEAWRLEIRTRTAACERGEATLYDADDVITGATRITQ